MSYESLPDFDSNAEEQLVTTDKIALGGEGEVSAPEPMPAGRRGIAPWWHMAVLICGILAFSFWGASGPEVAGGEPMSKVDAPRLIHYGLSGALELAVAGWVWFGLYLKGTPLRTLFGNFPRTADDIAKEMAVAAIFWLVAMSVLASFALTWNLVQTRVYQHRVQERARAERSQSNSGGGSKEKSKTSAPSKELESPQQQQIKMAKNLMGLAPANGIEIAAWGLLCLVVGFSEELIFRGYLQTQFLILARSVPAAIGLSRWCLAQRMATRRYAACA